MSIDEIQDEIIEEFTALDDWMDRYQLLIDLGGESPALDPSEKTEQNLIDGCQSRVWLSCRSNADGTLALAAESDALIVKGIVSLLVRVFNGQLPEDILAAELRFVREIGLEEHLSPTRANGLLAMVRQVRACALAHSLKKSGASH